MIPAALLALAALLLPATAAAQALVPPGNSAVNQYTETFPSAGGNSTGNQGGEPRTPEQVLGHTKAQRLEEQGPAGQATAALVAATAPSSTTAAAANGGKGNAKTTPTAKAPNPAGSSGLGEVLGQATGLSSSTGTSILLPLAIIATILWSLAYLWRRRRPVA